MGLFVFHSFNCVVSLFSVSSFCLDVVFLADGRGSSSDMRSSVFNPEARFFVFPSHNLAAQLALPASPSCTRLAALKKRRTRTDNRAPLQILLVDM
nr:hypothetical protein [Tolivirales sp.]